VAQWQGVATYAAARPDDPASRRAETLREIFGGSGVPALEELAALDRTDSAAVDALLGAVGLILADDVRAQSAGMDAPQGIPAFLVAELLNLAVQWFDDDVAVAAPLLAVFTGHGADPDETAPQADPSLVESLARWLSEKVATPVLIDRAEVISGGFSRLMLDVSWSAGMHVTRCVVRVEQGGMFATEGHREVEIMRALAAAGYPVPGVAWEEQDASVLGEPFFVMEHVAGAARLDDDGLDDVLRSVAALHVLDLDVVEDVAAVDGLPSGSTPEMAIAAQTRRWHEVYTSSAPHPIPLLERGFAWLEVNVRPTGPTVVVHGDPGPGNALHDGTGVAAVIDWEFAHAGDPAEDWAYLALIRGRRIMSPDEWKSRLERTVGITYDERTWQAWEAYNGVKGACVNLTALTVFATAKSPVPDHLAIGIAVSLRFLGRVVDLTGARSGR